ncbi:MAG: heterodisulfide reductase-related iron-sulfur binding cluster [Candidatus Hodarchaeota archaeon]
MMKERIKGRKNYPTDEVDPENFLDDNVIRDLMKKREKIKFSQNQFDKLFNCVHCGECESEAERFQLKQKFIEDGNTFDEINEMLEYFHKYRSPYPTNKMRIKRPKGIPRESDSLFFMGCLSTIRIPKYTEHALQFLLNQNIDFTILDTEICCGWHLLASGLKSEFEICISENAEIFKKFRKVICLCPACYYLFSNYLKPNLAYDIEFIYISEYIKPSKSKKAGRVGIQHLCQLMNRGKEGVDKLVDNILQKSGYEVIDVPHWCCGGGTGWMGRTDVIESIARKRMSDFDREDIDYATTYCPSCWWILRRFSKLCKIKPKAKDLFELLL